MTNWTQIEGNWDQMAGKIRQKWAKLTDDDLEKIKGRRDELVGVLKERYGEAREWAEAQVDDLMSRMN